MGFSFHKLEALEREQIRERTVRSRRMLLLLTERGRPIFKAHGVSQAIVFGSLARLEMDRQSDVDLLVSPLPAPDYFTLKQELEDASKRDIDLHTMNEDAAFTEKARREGIVIYEKER
jgi:predicted nucleotidyltransferase